jgi:hypothetical protein
MKSGKGAERAKKRRRELAVVSRADQKGESEMITDREDRGVIEVV